MSNGVTKTVAVDPADQLADQTIMKHLSITIGVMVSIAIAIGITANSIA